MKRFFTLILGVALIASMHSCETIEENNGQIVEKKLKITAVIDGKMETRVSYDVDNEANTITPAWELNDEVFGFDSNDNTFTLKVTALLENGATLEPVGSYSPTEGTAVYAIFAPGYSVSNLSNRTLAVNLAEQGGVLNASTPALMCATGSVNADNELNLSFSNQTAIIGVKKFQLNGATAAGSVTSMTINGVITSGTFQLNEGVLELVPGSETGSITASNATGWATDESGICTAGVYFAAMPTSEAPEITLNAVAGGIKYANVSAITASTMEPGKYYYMSKKLGGAVADVDGIGYATIDEAWAVANATSSPCTVTLLSDCETNHQLNLKDSDGTGVVTLNLGDYDITYTGASAAAVYINSSRELVITGDTGKITSSASSNSTIANYGSCTVSGGKIESVNYRTITTYNGATLNINGTAEIEGGAHGITNNDGITNVGGSAQITGAAWGLYSFGGTITIRDTPTITSTYSGGSTNGNAALYLANNSNTNTVNIYGGTFLFDGNVIRTAGSKCSINIYGGTFSNLVPGRTQTASAIYANNGVIHVYDGYVEAQSVNPVGKGSNGKIFVTGGCFNKPIQPDYAGDGTNDYVNILNPDTSTYDQYPFSVSPVASTPKVATVTQGSYVWENGSIESAFKNADIRALGNGNSTITLDDDCTASTTLEVSSGNTYSVTLNLNNHTIASTASPAVTSASVFSITDDGNEGELLTTGEFALVVTDSDATITSGSLYAANNAVNVSGGNLTINDGHFYGGGSADIINSGTIVIYGGWYRYNPSEWLSSSAGSIPGSYYFNERTYNYKVDAVVATVNGIGYPTLESASAAAISYDGSDDIVTLQLLDDITYNSTLNLTHPSKPVIFDINGHTLSTSAVSFIHPESGTLTITDSAEIKGKITSSTYQVLYIGGSTKFNVSNCVIECTQDEASAWNEQTAVLFGGSTMETTITNSKIYTTGYTTVIRINNANCKVTIDGDTEVSAGVGNDKGFYAILNNQGNLTINSGSFWTKSSTIEDNSPSALHHSGTNAKTIINSGYFYSEQERSISGNNGTITINGGYMNNVPSSNKVTFGAGKDIKSITPPATNMHSTINETLSYGFMVDGVVKASVNGIDYYSWSEAIDAANSYNGSESTVNLVLKDNILHTPRIIFENASDKPVILDLNGKKITANTDSVLIRSKVALTITDNSLTPGSIESKYHKVVYVYSTYPGPITIEKVLIKSTYTAESISGTFAASNSALYVNGSSASLTLKDNAKIWATAAHACYAGSSASVTIDNAEMTSSNYCIYMGTASINISGENTSFYGGTSSNGMMYCGNTNSSINISGGYFYRRDNTSPFHTNNINKYTLSGGYYKGAQNGSPTYPSGYGMQNCNVTHIHQTTGDEFTYTKMVAPL